MTIEARPLQPRQATTLLRATLDVLQTEVAALPEPILSWHPAVGEWCVKEVIGHLIEAERRGFAGRIRIVLSRAEPELESWDPAAVASDRHDCQKHARTLLDELAAMRVDSCVLVGNLRDEDRERGGHHPTVGHLRVDNLLHEWIHHDRNHIRQILANVQAFVWPGMGNAQKFSSV
jgi:hypothetical protein